MTLEHMLLVASMVAIQMHIPHSYYSTRLNRWVTT